MYYVLIFNRCTVYFVLIKQDQDQDYDQDQDSRPSFICHGPPVTLDSLILCEGGCQPGGHEVPAKTADFQEIYEDYYPKLLRYLTGLVGEADAEDLTQETMVKISNGLEQFRGDSSISTWIYRIATNVARDRFRSAAHKADSVTQTADDEELSAMLGSTKPSTGTLELITLRKEMNT